ncbi:Lysosome-associated membrane glycoprotein 5 [Nymphon striatum]|nr:Lysosome-associated membrane glycoprotein 5 [Nymphon striatum]
MLRKFVGLSEKIPEKKAKISQKEKDDVYETTKRKRGVVGSWKTEFPWLLVSEKSSSNRSTATDDVQSTPSEPAKLYCNPCRSVYGPLANPKRLAKDKYDKYANGPFVVGCSNLRHGALVYHQNSEGHKHAIMIQTAKTSKPGDMPADRALAKLNDKNFERLGKLFRNAHAIVKNCRPMTDFIWMAKLDKAKDVDIGDTYLNDKSCKEIIVAIAESTRHPIEQLLETTQPAPEDTFVVRDENGNICIIAKFEAKFAIKYKTTSGEQTLNTEMPENVKQRGTCSKTKDQRSLEVSWPNFMLRFRFKISDKCSKETVKQCWAVTDMTLSYNVTAEMFPDSTKLQFRTIRSDDSLVYFETPKEKAYTCPSPEVVPLFNSAKDERGTVRFTLLKMQPYDVIKGDYSTGSRCDQVSYGYGPEPYVDKTVPIAVGSSLAVLTLLCIIGYAIKRSIHERRVQYSNME